MWLKKVLAELSLALVISLSQCTGACWEFALEPIKLPFILSGVCSPSEANYCSNPFEVFLQRNCEPLIKETAPMLVFLFMEVEAGSADGRMMWRLILCVGLALIFQFFTEVLLWSAYPVICLLPEHTTPSNCMTKTEILPVWDSKIYKLECKMPN